MNAFNKLRITLTAKILILIIAIVVGANLIVGLITNTKATKALSDSVNAQFAAITNDLSNQIKGINEKELNTLHILANMDVFRDESISLAEKQRYLVGVAGRMERNYENLAFYDKDGNAITADGRTINFGTRAYFTEAFAGHDFISDPTFSKVTNSVLQHYSVPVYNDSGNTIGAIVLVINGNALLDTVKHMDLGDGMYPSVINRQSMATIATGNEGLDDKNIDYDSNSTFGKILTNLFEGKTDQEVFYEPIIGKNLIAAYQPVEGTTWSVFAVAPYDVYFKEINSLHFFLSMLMIGSILVCIIVCGIFVKLLFKPLGMVKDSVLTIASGNADLTQRLPSASNDEIGDVVGGFNQFVEKLQSIIENLQNSQNKLSQIDENLQNSTVEAASSITEIISNIQSVNGQILAQAQSVHETAEAIQKNSDVINNLESMIESQAQNVSEASSAVEQMIGNINSVNGAVGKMVDSFSTLEANSKAGIQRQEEVTKMINQIEQQSIMLEDANKAIGSIASQTNLLAMNAAIEAAHAGESGKGFSVVADEIRKLSETSTSQSKTISAELKKIKDTISEVVISTTDTNKAFSAVSDSVSETSMILSQIKGAMEEQQIGSKQIIDSLQQMNDSTIEVKKASSTMTGSNSVILTEINKLQEATDIIKGSVYEMQVGAERINGTGAELSEISKQVTESIHQIGDEVGLFKV